MSAVPSKRYQAKKLRASEREQQKYKPFVPAVAIQIIVVITSRGGAWLTTRKCACTQAVLALIAAGGDHGFRSG